jgi:hypothetical protein
MKKIVLLVLVLLLVWALPAFAQKGDRYVIMGETVFIVMGENSTPVDIGYRHLILGNHDAAIRFFRKALDDEKSERVYGGLAMAYCFKGDFFLSAWCYQVSLMLGNVPNPFLEARLFPGPRDIVNGQKPVFFKDGLENVYFQMEGHLYLLDKRGNYVKVPISSKARFLDKPYYLPPCLKQYDIKGSKGSAGKFYEVYLPPDFNLLTPRKPVFFKVPVEPLEERW